MTRRTVRGSKATLPALVAILIAACGAGPTGSLPGSPSSIGPVATAPSIAVASSGSATPAPAASGVASPAPPSDEPTVGDQPPDAALAVEGGDPVTGQLGSYTWDGGGSDAPWLPGTPVDVGAGETLSVDLPDVVGVADWSARRVPAGSTDGDGPVDMGRGQTQIVIPAPPVGIWSVQIQVRFAGDLGSAAYYWQVTVR